MIKTIRRLILLVEDEAIIRMGLHAELLANGFAVQEAGTCAEAIAKLEAHPQGFHAAIVDVGLPDGRGDALADHLRTRCPELPIVLCTAYRVGELNCSAFDAGRIAVVSKPWTTSAIMRGLRAAELAIERRALSA